MVSTITWQRYDIRRHCVDYKEEYTFSRVSVALQTFNYSSGNQSKMGEKILWNSDILQSFMRSQRNVTLDIHLVKKWILTGRVYNSSNNIHNIYRQTSNISRTLVGNKIVHHSDAFGTSPVGAAPSASSFSTKHLASMDWAKGTARRDEKSVGIRWVLY